MGNPIWIELAWPIATVISALIAVRGAFLTWRSAEKTLRHKQYETAAAQLQDVNTPGSLNYVTRTAAIATLAKLAKDHPEDYDEPVMRAFEAFLSFPPRYGKNAKKENQVDYTSRDTVAITDAINGRPKGWWRGECWQKAYAIGLPPDRPFRVTQDGKVECNPDYEDPYSQRNVLRHDLKALRDAFVRYEANNQDTDADTCIDRLMKKHASLLKPIDRDHPDIHIAVVHSIAAIETHDDLEEAMADIREWLENRPLSA